MLAGVLAAGDAEAKVEVEAFEQLVAEVVPLDHAEVVDRLVSHCELHRGSHLPQAEEGRRELVADKAPSIGVQVPRVDGQPLCNVPQLGLSGLQVGPMPTRSFTPGTSSV